ncbi:D-methionine transport system substrate-binding protein [Nocardia transvalensis]|uniref:D-methionine transport system substrate-binding protein n=1 Tax=Nocardia transvalensis TaxID=37333 RepID=A0A7W9PI38_9NOCA|nr:MetQ/NlpA family ABC transporter substrate-binding protein [Nocardia transvalensis]MBB5915938.1 D-methionine transport system substrate-binding protein [Nocardia transvalensis]
MRLLRRFPAITVPIALGVFLAALLTSCGAEHSSDVVRVGVNDLALPHWEVLRKKAAAQGITVEYVNFTDYNQPNPALAQGRIDLNKFQHIRYLANYNARNDDTLVPIGATEIFPLTLYSEKHRSVADIPAGGRITLSNNPANQVRPLLGLAAAGLIVLKGGATWDSKIEDVDTGASKIRLTTIDPTLTAQSLDSVDAAFVDDTFARQAGLGHDQVIFTDDPQRPELRQYINVFAARAADKNDPKLLAVARLYHDPEVEQAVRAEAGYDGIFKTDDPADLEAALHELEGRFRN